MQKLIFLLCILSSSIALKSQSYDDSLYYYVNKGDTSLAKFFINKGGNINLIKQQSWMKTNLLIASINKKDISMSALLIESGVDIDWQDNFKTTALMYAASNGQEVIVKKLLDRHANVMIKDSQGNDALSAAKESKNQKIISLIADAQKRSNSK